MTTTFDAANRPTLDAPGGAYASDLDGRTTQIPSQRGIAVRTLAYDSLGRLTSVTLGGVTRYYGYDPLDRLRLVSTGGVTVEGFRYVGRTATIAQTIDGSGNPLRSEGTDRTGTHLLDWTGTGQNVRFYGTNGHGDLTWTADTAGAVAATLHYDPYGTLVASTGTSLPEFRFQGSWSDTTAGLSWAVARWYAPSMGTFLTEDSLLGTPADPSSRQLYAYGAGDPVDRSDPSGWHYLVVDRSLVSWTDIAEHYYGMRGAAGILSKLCGNLLCPAYGPRPGVKYWLPNRMYVFGSGWRSHTVYRGDDPIDKPTGYVFGPPYSGDPLRAGFAAWRPAVLSPLAACSNCVAPVGAISLGSIVTGPLIGMKSWKKADYTQGLVQGWPLYSNTVTFMANQRRFVHGSLLTLWVNYDYSGIMPACNPADGDDACAESIHLSYGVKYRRPYAVTDDTVYGSFRIKYLTGALMTFSRSAWYPPTDYRHMVVWFPRAAGRLSSFSFSSAIYLSGGGVVNSGYIPASSAPIWQWP